MSYLGLAVGEFKRDNATLGPGEWQENCRGPRIRSMPWRFDDRVYSITQGWYSRHQASRTPRFEHVDIEDWECK